MSKVLELKNLSYVYGTGTPFEKTAVNNLSLSIEKGEFIGIMGHTGSGKSTLVQMLPVLYSPSNYLKQPMLNGLMKPTSGQVLLDGEDIWANPKDIRKIRFKVGMVFQYPEYQLFEETVAKDIAFGPTNMGKSGAELEKAVNDAARFTGLKDELLEKSPFDLSGGEKRRAAIAGVIAMNPEVLVLDEPTAGLDPMGRDVLLSQIVQYHKERKNTVILVSHSMEDIARVADKIIVMNKSNLVMFDKTKEVFSKGRELEKIGLRVPQITKIMLELREKGFNVPEGILTVDEAMDCISSLLDKEGKIW
jgi:energy-coupling factor transport system ATP-binding protein